MSAITHGRIGVAPDAVLGFFGLSGYLVAASWRRSLSLADFLRRRFLRIVPGFWACLFGTAFLLAPVVERSHGAFPFRSAFGFVWRNAALHVRQTTIGSVSAGNLWSIWPEFTCYLGLAALGLVGGISGRRMLLVAAFAGLAAAHLFFLTGGRAPFLPAHLAVSLRQLAPYYLAFVAGLALDSWSAELVPRGYGLGVIAAVLAASAFFGGYAVVSPVLIPWLVVGLGESGNLRLRSDASYGIYMYGFVIQQLMFSLPWFGSSWLRFFVGSLVAAFAAGWLSWHLVERHFKVHARQ